MKKCFECGCVFEEPTTYLEDYTPGETSEFGSFIYKYDGCPQCGEAFGSVEECAICGEWDYIDSGCYNEHGFVCSSCNEEIEMEEMR